MINRLLFGHLFLTKQWKSRRLCDFEYNLKLYKYPNHKVVLVIKERHYKALGNKT